MRGWPALGFDSFWNFTLASTLSKHEIQNWLGRVNLRNISELQSDETKSFYLSSGVIARTEGSEVILPSRSEWLEGWPDCLPGHRQVCFTDESKLEPREEEWFHRGSLASVFQADICSVEGSATDTPARSRG